FSQIVERNRNHTPVRYEYVLKRPTVFGPHIPRPSPRQIQIYSLFAIALMNSSLLSTVGFSIVVIRARSFVISPASIVSIVAFSRRSAHSIRSLFPSSSPRFLSAPVHAKIVATELVEVSSPFKCL